MGFHRGVGRWLSFRTIDSDKCKTQIISNVGTHVAVWKSGPIELNTRCHVRSYGFCRLQSAYFSKNGSPCKQKTAREAALIYCFSLRNLERARRIERPTLTLARLCSTPELRPRSKLDAGYGLAGGDFQAASWQRLTAAGFWLSGAGPIAPQPAPGACSCQE